MIDKLDLNSMNITKDKRDKLKELFPEVFSEGSIDFDALRTTLGELVDDEQERYEMKWAGKKNCFKAIQNPSIATLKPVRDDSVEFDITENLYIEGDNLEVLKLLQKSYYGKVKMIYIDPPYNTGKDFVYPDNYKDNLKNYLELTGQVDSEGKKISSNVDTDGRYHSNWLNMMYPRLFLARHLLKDDGVIFISIDDNEVTNLKKICDEIFGEENFIAQFVWQKKYSRDNRPLIGVTHEYILMYAKVIEEFKEVRNLLPPTEESLKVYKNPNNDPKGRWRGVPMTAQAGHATASQFYEVITPTGVIHTPSKGRCWAVSEDKYKELLKEGRIYFGKDNSSQPNIIRYMSEIKGFVPWTWLPSSDVGHTDAAMKEFYGIMGKDTAFETPKPTSLVMHFSRIAMNKNDIVLDFFSGTATTAHAVMKLNAEDGGNRKFIMVQLPEPIEKKTVAYKDGYINICEIGKERIRRAGKQILDELGESNGQLKIDEERKEVNLDNGFKVFRLDKSNFKLWDSEAKEDLQQMLFSQVDNIDANSSDEDILYEILLKAGYGLDLPIEQLELAGKKVYSLEGGLMLVSLDRNLTLEFIKAMADMEPIRVVCLDKGFANNDALKTNAVEIMKSKNVEDFRTV